MKIIITENQFRKVINEIGGYDDRHVMYTHAQSVQEPLLRTLSTTVDVLNNFIQTVATKSDLNKGNIINYIDNLKMKLTLDIDLIDKLGGEIYIDVDFRDLIKNYKSALQNLQNRLSLLHSDSEGGYGMAYDMSKNEIIESILNEISNLEHFIIRLSKMFKSVHGRYISRLGIDN